jgi:hypothetical protein
MILQTRCEIIIRTPNVMDTENSIISVVPKSICTRPDPFYAGEYT